MESEAPSSTDDKLRDRILTGVAAVAELETRFRQPLERFLFGLCDRSDGRSQEKAVEIAGQILAECFIKSPSLLERWKGQDNLEAFLRTAARNRLKTWWASVEKKRVEVDSDSHSLANTVAEIADVDRHELVLAERSLHAGVEAAVEKCPEGLVFMRLKGLHGVGQREISACWGHHEAQTSRRISEAMGIIRAKAFEMAAAAGCELSIDLLQRALQRNTAILLGHGDNPVSDSDSHLLRSLAAGAAHTLTKCEAIETMCRNSRAVEFFAQVLNRQSKSEALVMKDPVLSGMQARLTECVRRTLDILEPSEAVALVTPLMKDSFGDLLEHVRADGGTLWLLCPGEAALEAVFNPLEPEIAGTRQPLVSGIISLVLATGEPACVSGLSAHAHHSPAIDMRLGKTTQAMIAVPFTLAGSVRGVLTAVRLTGENAFGERETRILGRQAEILSHLMVQNLTASILA